MQETQFAAYLLTFMMNVILLAGVPLAVATLLGLFVSLFQAVTQIQDQTLSQTVKIAAIVIVLLAFGGALVAPLMQSTNDIFNSFADITR